MESHAYPAATQLSAGARCAPGRPTQPRCSRWQQLRVTPQKSELNGTVNRAKRPKTSSWGNATRLSCAYPVLRRVVLHQAPDQPRAPHPHLHFHKSHLPPSSSSASGTSCWNRRSPAATLICSCLRPPLSPTTLEPTGTGCWSRTSSCLDNVSTYLTVSISISLLPFHSPSGHFLGFVYWRPTGLPIFLSGSDRGASRSHVSLDNACRSRCRELPSRSHHISWTHALQSSSV